MHKLLLLTTCMAAALATPEPGYYTQNYWPTRVTPYSYSTCYGCYGKRSADAQPGYLGYAYGLPTYGYGYGLRSYGYGIGRVSTGVGLHPTGAVYESRSAQGLGKRSADAEPGYYTQNYWPTRVTPYSYSTCYGCYGKRSADAEPGYLGYGYGLPAYGYGYGYGIGRVSTGVGLHPTGSVYESRSAQGLRGRYLY